MGKSELAAAVALLLTCGDGEERAEVYGCAADRQQASIVFEVAADMVRMCPALNRRVKILTATKRIVYLPTNSFYQVLSAEAYSKHGFNIHGVVFDELHTQPNRKLFDVMTKGSGDARMQPLYDVWERQGYLQTTEGNVVHYGYIERFIERLGERFNIREIAFDRWGAVQMVQNLEGMGFTVVPFGQGFKDMSPPTKELMKLVLEQRIAHAGHPVLRWMMDNIYVRTDPAGNIKPDNWINQADENAPAERVLELYGTIAEEGGLRSPPARQGSASQRALHQPGRGRRIPCSDGF